MDTERYIKVEDVVKVVERINAMHGTPCFIKVDNGIIEVSY
ncbi:hypothetical protein ACFLV5_04085 [Chloroflexota bacterium]